MSEITASVLNQQIVELRTVVGQARFRLNSRLIRSARQLKQSKKDASKVGRKIDRLHDEIKSLKGIRADDVTKFALLNLKTLKDLNIRGNTPASERALFKLATEPVLVQAVNEFRKSHPNWHQEVPFVLQRLGLQYRGKKKQKNEEKEEEGVESGDEESENGSDGEAGEESDQNSDGSDKKSDEAAAEPPLISPIAKAKKPKRPEPVKKRKPTDDRVSKLVASQIKKEARKSKKEGLKKKKKSNEPRIIPQPAPLPDPKVGLTQPIKRGQGEIRRIALDGKEEEEEGENEPDNGGEPQPDTGKSSVAITTPSSSFFLGGVDAPDDKISDASRENDVASSGKKFKSMFASSLTARDEYEQDRTSVPKWKNRNEPMRKARDQQQPTRKQPFRTKGAPTYVKPPPSQQEGPLHPSWEAKRKMKEKMELNKGATPQGKKIRFDED